MDYNSTNRYLELVDRLTLEYNVSTNVTSALEGFTLSVFRVEQENMYTEPTSWIGLYIAAASVLCIFAMAADLLHGVRNRKLWFPCNYFTINAAFLSVISVAMKLPTDITSSMPGDVDQVTKLGSMAFLCTMMANLLPSLATMNSKELRTNITALGVMVITLVVNVCIQIQTGVVSYSENGHFAQAYARNVDLKSMGIADKDRNSRIAIIYVTLLLMLLMIHACSSLSILKSKKMIDVKYQELHEIVSKEPQSDRLTVEELRQHVSKYWIMAGTGSPQLITICSVTTSACGVICVLSTTLHILTLVWTIQSVKDGDYKSDYKWTMLVIFIIQFIGVILGTIAPVCRCFAPLCFKVSIESIKNHLKVFQVESYWTHKLYDWKPRRIPLPFRSGHKCKVITEHVKIFSLKLCKQFQEAVVVACKIISLVPFFFMICAFYCFKCLKEAVVSTKSNEESPGNRNEDLIRRYVLQLQDETKISGTTLKWLSKSLESLIKKGEKRQQQHVHGDLIKLIKQSSDFKGVEMFDSDHVTSLLSKEYPDCWSLPVVTLTTIAVSLPGIEKSKADELLASVIEGLVYVTHVEESLNTSNDHVSIRKAAETLWLEFEVHQTWFKNNMREIASPENTTRENIQLFKKKLGEDMVKEVALDNGSLDENSKCKSICANSMYRITDTILLSNKIDSFSHEKLFEHLSQMISGILAACLTNLPKVIVTKCHTNEIEKREASVQAAGKILGETTQIINTLKDRDLLGLDPNDDLPFIDKWRACLSHAYP